MNGKLVDTNIHNDIVDKVVRLDFIRIQGDAHGRDHRVVIYGEKLTYGGLRSFGPRLCLPSNKGNIPLREGDVVHLHYRSHGVYNNVVWNKSRIVLTDPRV